MTVEQIIEIIRKHKVECEQAQATFDDVAASGMRYIPQSTVDRKQYAIAAQIERLQAILEEIGVEKS